MPSDAFQNQEPSDEGKTELNDSIKQVVLEEQPEDKSVFPKQALGAKLRITN